MSREIDEWLKSLDIAVPDFEEPRPDETELAFVLRDILTRHNNTADEAEKHVLVKPWKPGYSMKLEAQNDGNLLAAVTYDDFDRKDNHIVIGFYSPADRAYVIFGDYIEEEGEEELLKESAVFAHRDAIDQFNRRATSSQTRLDFFHPDVQEMHAEHKEFFDVNGDTRSILDRYNFLKPATSDAYEDRSTRAAVYLERIEANGLPFYRKIGVRIMGAYTRSNGMNFRIYDNTLNLIIAEHDQYYEGPQDDLAFTITQDHYIDPYATDGYIEQAELVKALDIRGDLGGKFDPVKLGILLPTDRSLIL
jgi:hypothetical protein